jgi:2,3-bisphosphoglycerate-dependent phosphoglycerate mutase
VTERAPEGIRLLSSGGGVRARLVLVRHGEPVCAVKGIVGGPTGDTGLTQRGRDQVLAVAGRLASSKELGEVAALYASSLPRAIETAELLAPALGELPVTVRHDLREHDPGEMDGMLWSEAIAKFPIPNFDTHPEVPVAPGGDSLIGFHERVRAALRELAGRYLGETAVIACHGGVVAAAVGAAFSIPTNRRMALPTHFSSMTEIWATPEGFELARYNDRYPLTDPLDGPRLGDRR